MCKQVCWPIFICPNICFERLLYSVYIVPGMYNFEYYYYTYLMKYLHCIIIEAHPWAFLLMYIKTIAWCMMTRCHLHGFASPIAKGMPTMVGFGKFHPDIFVQNYNNLPLYVLYFVLNLSLSLFIYRPNWIKLLGHLNVTRTLFPLFHTKPNFKIVGCYLVKLTTVHGNP